MSRAHHHGEAADAQSSLVTSTTRKSPLHGLGSLPSMHDGKLHFENPWGHGDPKSIPFDTFHLCFVTIQTKTIDDEHDNTSTKDA